MAEAKVLRSSFLCLEVRTPIGADGFLRPAQTYVPTTERRKNNAPPCTTTGRSPKKYQGPAETPHQAHACSLLLGGGPYPNTETPLGARRPIANVECSQAGIGIARAIPVRSHFLGSCGRNVALVQYLIGPMSGKTVTRADLYRAIYQKVGLSRTQSAPLVELVLKEITDCLERGETVKLSSFGLFVVRQKGQRLGRNPRTGEEVPISPRRVVVFKPSAVLKQRINAPRSPFR
jgi:integration host factor subunit alpha